MITSFREAMGENKTLCDYFTTVQADPNFVGIPTLVKSEAEKTEQAAATEEGAGEEKKKAKKKKAA
jgi:hypothetical protein